MMLLNGVNLNRANRKHSQETEKSLRNFLEVSVFTKLFLVTIHRNLAILVKNYHGITELQHLIDPRRTRTVFTSSCTHGCFRDFLQDISRLLGLALRFSRSCLSLPPGKPLPRWRLALAQKAARGISPSSSLFVFLDGDVL